MMLPARDEALTGLEALDRVADRMPTPSPHAAWWRIHQIVVALLADGMLIAGLRALSAFVALCLALGIALAALVLEPATIPAAFGDLHAGD